MKIGEVIGKRDHSTVIHGVEKIEKDLKKDSNLQNIIDVITKRWNKGKLSTNSVDNLWISCELLIFPIFEMLITLGLSPGYSALFHNLST